MMASALMRGNKGALELAAKRLLTASPKNPGGYGQDFYRAMYYLGRTPLATTQEVRDFPKPQPLPNNPLANIAYYYALTRGDFWAGKTDSPFLKQLDDAVNKYPVKTKCPDDLKNFQTE